jgi:hypothetical protein
MELKDGGEGGVEVQGEWREEMRGVLTKYREVSSERDPRSVPTSLFTGEFGIDRGANKPVSEGHIAYRNTSCWHRLSSRRGADYSFEPSLRGERTS